MKSVEEMLREIYGYTDEQLLEDARMAEEELMREGGAEVTQEEIEAMLEKIHKIKPKRRRRTSVMGILHKK